MHSGENQQSQKLVLWEFIFARDMPLLLISKKKREKTQVTNIRNEKGAITTELRDIKW